MERTSLEEWEAALWTCRDQAGRRTPGGQPLPNGPTDTGSGQSLLSRPSWLSLVLPQPAEAFLAKLDPGQGSGLAMLGAYTPSKPQERKGIGLLGSHGDSAPMGPGRTEGAKRGRMVTPKRTMVSDQPSQILLTFSPVV